MLSNNENVSVTASGGEREMTAVVTKIAELFKIAGIDIGIIPEEGAVNIGSNQNIFELIHNKSSF